MIWLLVAIGLLLALPLVAHFGARASIGVLFVASCTLAPWPLVGLGAPDLSHVGVAPSVVTLSTYSGAGVLAVIAYWSDRRARTALVLVFRVAAVILGALTGILAVAAWQSAPGRHLSGSMHYVLALLLVSAGVVAVGYARENVRAQRALRLAIVSIMVLELLFCVAQLLGLPASVYSDVVSVFLREGRAIGTFNHPSVLGKIVLILLVPLFLWTLDGSSRRSAWIGIAAGSIATAMTQSRANTVAVLFAVGVWIVFGLVGVSGGRRIVFMVVGAFAAWPLLTIGLSRFGVDAEGGARSYLLSLYRAIIPEYWWTGLGANSYVDVVGSFDATTAGGLPVHNSFLLVLAEIGLLGAVFLLLPFVALLVVALTKSARPDGRAPAVASLATIPGLLLVLMTGWGMMANGTLLLWYFFIGWSLGALLIGDSRGREAQLRSPVTLSRIGDASCR